MFLLRPLLSVGRAELRAWLQARGVGWIDDPANADLRFGRSRARLRLEPGQPAPPLAGERAADAAAVRDCFGVLHLRRDAMDHATLAAALLCAGGGTEPPRGRSVDALLARLRSGGAFSATLAGARLVAAAGEAAVGREAGRAGLPPLPLQAARAAVWDGRFEINPAEAGEVRSLAGSAGRLPREEREALKAVPPPLRRTLPLVVTAAGGVFCPLLGPEPQARSLVGERWLAACGAVTREQEIPG